MTWQKSVTAVTRQKTRRTAELRWSCCSGVRRLPVLAESKRSGHGLGVPAAPPPPPLSAALHLALVHQHANAVHARGLKPYSKKTLFLDAEI